MAYKLTFPGQEKELERSFVREIADDVWMLEGYVSDYFLLKPASSNTFILRDGRTVLVVDPGLYPFYRGRILDLIAGMKRGGVDRLILTDTQGHFDHVGNNDVVLETGIEDTRFVMAAPELGVIDILNDFLADFDNLNELYDVYSTFDGPVSSAVRVSSKLSPGLARSLLKAHFAMLFRGLGTMRDRAQVLELDSRVRERFGSVELEGWDLGRFFLVHDGSHSPGHVSVYDREARFLLSGDVTVEINPAFYYSSLDRCIEYCGKFRTMAEEGWVEVATDSHRSPTFLPMRYERWKMEPLSDLELVDVARGREQCAAFFGFFADYFSRLRESVLRAHRSVGESTVPRIVGALESEDDPAMRMKRAMKFERIPSRLDVLVASVLRESGCGSIPTSEGTVFTPVEESR